MRVELDVFSGRPNPAWQLADAEATELARRLSGLSSTGRAPPAGALGYRGLVVTNPEARAGLPARLRVYNGVVSVETPAQTNHYRDENHIERWLLDQARSHGYAPIVDQVLKGNL